MTIADPSVDNRSARPLERIEGMIDDGSIDRSSGIVFVCRLLREYADQNHKLLRMPQRLYDLLPDQCRKWAEPIAVVYEKAWPENVRRAIVSMSTVSSGDTEAMVRAVLDSMRNPTPAVMSAGLTVAHMGGSDLDAVTLAAVWHAMIDEAVR